MGLMRWREFLQHFQHPCVVRLRKKTHLAFLEGVMNELGAFDELPLLLFECFRATVDAPQHAYVKKELQMGQRRGSILLMV